jgi:hypothetical protein
LAAIHLVLVCVDKSSVSDKCFERHALANWQISLDVRGKKTLEESLDFYCQGELMEGDNQYFCEEIGKKVGQHAAVVDCDEGALTFARHEGCGLYI